MLKQQGKLSDGFISLELGCGSALPSMATIISLGGSHAIATDSETLPLKMLREAVGKSYHKKLTTDIYDLRQVQNPSMLSTRLSSAYTSHRTPSIVPDMRVDCCIASDLLYTKDIAEKLAWFLAEKYIDSKGNCHLIVTSPSEGRQGKDYFVKKFTENIISSDTEQYADFDAFFEECLVPEWMNDDCVDGFDGCKIESIGVLRYGLQIRTVGQH